MKRLLQNFAAVLTIPVILAWDVLTAVRDLRRLRRQWRHQYRPKEAPRGLKR